MTSKNKLINQVIVWGLTVLALIVVGLWAVNTGSIKLTPIEIFKGLFISYDSRVAAIYDLRFPRIIIALLVGAGISVSGCLLQSVLKNPLTDPGIIGVSGGASLAVVIITAAIPSMYYLTPVAAFLGGMSAFIVVYALSWKEGVSTLRVILIGVAVSTFLSGISSAINTAGGSAMSGVASIVNGNISMKTWQDVKQALYYIPLCLVIAWCMSRQCNLLALDDKTARGIGVNVNRSRILISLVAVMLASIGSALVGTVSFLGLLVPHIARMWMGSNHKVLIPYCGLLGSVIFMLADTLGRVIAMPYEISASVIMAVVGGPAFIILLRRSREYV